MKSIITCVLGIPLIILIIIGLTSFFKNNLILQISPEKSLKIARSKVEIELATELPKEEILKEFDRILEKAKAGQIKSGSLKNFLLWLPYILKEDNLDSAKVDRIIKKLHTIVEVEQI